MQIKRLLIANRGEISVRIINTCKALGIRTIQPFIQQEENEKFAQIADIPVKVSNLEQGELHPYLNINKMISIAKDHKADAIHPGYGFLSENPLFPKACRENNIIFIGPTYEQMSFLSSKIRTKEVCASLNIPAAKSLVGKITKDQIKKLLRETGGPLLIKAASGGGGRGIRLLTNESEIDKLLHESSEEARRFFKDPSVFVEQYIKNARHVEVQIAGDKHGNYIHFFERECSIQRRNQKLIEEAPCISISDSTKEEIHKAALKLVSHAKYNNLGTVEFLVDENEQFYLQEVNTRLQVEHPVTEAITNNDLVALQLDIACGANIQNLPVQQSGHAIECRIVAEDPFNKFIPSTGKIQKLHIPNTHFVRTDTYINEGTVISPMFDSLIAKIISWGRTRQEAIERLNYHLDNTVILGVNTTIGLFRQIINDKNFRNNNININYLNSKQFSIPQSDVSKIIALASYLEYTRGVRSFISSQNLPEISKWKQGAKYADEL